MQWPTKEFIPFVLFISTVKKCPSLFFHASFTWETAFYTCFITQPNVLQKPTLDTYLHPSVFLIINYKIEQVGQEYHVFFRGENFQLKNKRTLENKINTNCSFLLWSCLSSNNKIYCNLIVMDTSKTQAISCGWCFIKYHSTNA